MTGRRQYADGLPWRLSGVGEVLLHGCRAPIVGRISMDYTTIDVGQVPDARVGDLVTLLGRDGSHAIGLAELARRVGTIPHELACRIGERVSRVYYRLIGTIGHSWFSTSLRAKLAGHILEA